MFDWVFAFFHLFLILAVFAYAVSSLIKGNIARFLIIAVLLAAYYFLVLHKAVKKEIERNKKNKFIP